MGGMLSPQREAVALQSSVLLMQEGVLPWSQRHGHMDTEAGGDCREIRAWMRKEESLLAS